MSELNNQTTSLNKPINLHHNSAQVGLHPVILELLEKRGISDQKALEEFFSWNLNELHPLSELKDLDKTARRIIQAINAQERIGIYGDYDVDGTTSCALFAHFFKMLNIKVSLYQPSRFVEGYGIHPSAIDRALEDGIGLLISVDCGISNTETAQYALDKNIDLIITDHHKDAMPEMPKAYAIVNPNRRDEPADSPLCALAGVGVAFAVCLQVKKLLEENQRSVPSIYPLLQFVAIGTICDMAHLNPTNLKLARHGLKQMAQTQFAGINCFLNDEDRKYPVIPSDKISFYIGPHINSKGRLDHPEKALDLLMANDHREAFACFAHLETSNRERKIIQAQVFEEAKKQVVGKIKNGNHLVSIVYAPHWHEGVIGIVASKLVETFGVPAIVFTDSEDKSVIKASARSAGELNLFDCLKACDDLFLKFGGHKAAAGLSMPKKNYEAFEKRLTELLLNVPAISRTQQDHFDADISLLDINKQLIRELEQLEPFGMGNPRPVFRMKDAIIDSYKILKDQHVKWDFRHKGLQGPRLSGISFFFIDKWQTLHPQELFHRQSEGLTVYFTLGVNRFRGNETIQLMVEKIFLN